MAISTFKPEIWESALLESFKGITIADLITKKPTKIEGTKAIFNAASLATGLQDYTGTVNYEEVITNAIELVYDKTKYFAFAVDDVDKAQAVADVMLPITNEQAYKIKEEIDSAVFAEAVLGAKTSNVIGSPTTKEAITTCDEAYDYIVDLGTKLDNNNVPAVGRYVIAKPEFVNLLAKDKRVIDNAVVLANGIVQGMNIDGIQVVKTNLCPANQVIALSNIAVGYGKQIDEVEALRLQTSFSDAVRGLVSYGVKTLQGEGIAVLNYEIQ